MEHRVSPHPEFDWRGEQGGQKRELSRFGAELERVLSLRGASAAARQAGLRIRERWDKLIRRIEGRWARGGDLWDRQGEQIERLRAERSVLEAMVEYDEQLGRSRDIDHMLKATLRVLEPAVPSSGAIVQLADIGGRSYRVATERGHGRPWPPAADRELTDQIAAGVRDIGRITIEGRPVKSGPKEQNRVAHWLAVSVAHDAGVYGAIVVGRAVAEEAYAEENAEVLERIGERLGAVLAARAGVGVRPVLGSGVKPQGFEHLWGEATAYRQALALAARFALSDSPVVIQGEMGTGRRTLAQAIHRRSPRTDGPFGVFSGTDLPAEVVARGLFGESVSGAEGRVVEHPGDLELADGGTLYIDDLSALDMVLQVRLLRFLTEGVFERIGDRTPRRANVRLMIGTTADPEGEVAKGRLRADLYYLITAARVVLPPLRERGGDIIELARRYAVAAGQKVGKQIDGIDAEAARLLSSAPFPGNVRQLVQVIERAAFVCAGPLITALDLPREMSTRVVAAPLEAGIWVEQAARAIRLAGEAGQSGDYRQFRRARRLVVNALDAAFAGAVLRAVGRHPSRAARHCGIHRAQWWRLWRTVQEGQGATGRETTDSGRVRQDSNQ